MEIVYPIMGDMIRYFHGDVRRINHALKVFGLASLIASESGLSERNCEITQTAALLHDIGIHAAEQKYQSTEGKYQEIEGPPIAREIMTVYPLDGAFIDRVCFLIGNHHNYTKIDGTDFQILVEADLLVNIFEDSVGCDSIRKCEREDIQD